MLDLIVLLISILIITILGTLIVFRNIKNLSFQLFGLFNIIAVTWFVANYFSNHISSYDLLLFINKLSLFVGLLLVISVWLLSIYFPQHIIKHPIQKIIALIVTPILLVLTLFTNEIVSSVKYIKSDSVAQINNGNLYFLYIFTSFIFLVFLSFNFYKSYRLKSLSQIQRQQVIYLSLGFFLSFIWSILTAAIIPAITHNWYISKFGAVSSLFVVFFLSYAIIKHKLFDIRLIIARSFSYFLTLIFISLILITPLIMILTRILNINLSFGSILLISLVTFIVSVIFQPITILFNKYTNRLFYRDYYEPQIVLDKLSNLLVGSINSKLIIEGSSKILEEAIRPKFLKFDFSKNQSKDKHLNELRRLISEESNSVIVLDEINQMNDSSLYNLLIKRDIAVVMKLRTGDDEIGYIFVGYKESGAVYSEKDIRLMSIASDEIAISLQNALRYQEIQRFNATLQEKIEVATRQLTRANSKLKTLDQTKDDFISMASHQLRTPLTSVKGYLSMVLEGDAGAISKEQNKMLTQAFDSSQRMVYLISDLLNISRLQTGKFIIERTDCDLSKIIDDEINLVHETAEARNIRISYKKPSHFPVLSIDEIKTRQVIMNFLDNAIYYTPPGGEITISIEDMGQTVELKVTDTGIGVPASVAHHLFTKFYRAENAKKARPDGTGLGLFMAKKVIIAQGGSIIFSTKENKGSTFGFSLPKKA